MDPRQQPTPPPTPNEPQSRQPQPPQDMDAFGVQPPVSTPQTAQPHQAVSPEMPRKGRKTLAFALLLGPTVLIAVAFLCTLLAGQLGNAVAPNEETFGDTPVAVTILNLISFIGMTVGIIVWLPGLIIGIVLLARRKK